MIGERKRGRCECCGSHRADLRLYYCPNGLTSGKFYCAPCCRSTIGYRPRSKVPFDRQMSNLQNGRPFDAPDPDLEAFDAGVREVTG